MSIIYTFIHHEGSIEQRKSTQSTQKTETDESTETKQKIN